MYSHLESGGAGPLDLVWYFLARMVSMAVGCVMAKGTVVVAVGRVETVSIDCVMAKGTVVVAVGIVDGVH